jgi:hypothetical protein
MSDRIRIGDCRFGKGIFACSKIREGEVILRFTGPLIDSEKVDAKGIRECDPLQIGPGTYMDIGPPGVFVNHSCAPNAGIRDDVKLVAIAEINAGEEIFYDYSTTMCDEHWTLSCLCGSPLCRGNIGDFKELPSQTRQRYLHFGIVQSYVARQYLRPVRRKLVRVKPPKETPSDSRADIILSALAPYDLANHNLGILVSESSRFNEVSCGLSTPLEPPSFGGSVTPPAAG